MAQITIQLSYDEILAARRMAKDNRRKYKDQIAQIVVDRLIADGYLTVKKPTKNQQ